MFTDLPRQLTIAFECRYYTLWQRPRALRRAVWRSMGRSALAYE